MTQNTDILLVPLNYTRGDYTALRAYCLKLPIERIASLYYSDDSVEVEMGLERFLIRMRDALVERAIESNPAFVDALTHARKTGHISAKMLDILVQAADARPVPPSPGALLSKWFRPRTASALRSDAVSTIGDLVALINRRGATWWRSVPRIGAKRSAVIVRWLQQHEAQLGKVQLATLSDELPSGQQLLDPQVALNLLPLGRFFLPLHLDGHDGINRAANFCFISARDDLAAIGCYLARFDGQHHTQRAYRKELERFLLWAVHVVQKPLSSLLVDDCEAYKRFLAAPAASFRGRSATRGSPLWRPFSESSMSAASQKYALTVLRAAFDYWVKVRYLAGNPWAAVKDPVVVQEVTDIQVHRALSFEGWNAVVQTLIKRGQVCTQVQDRIALVAILLMGDSGLRREEAARATRTALRPSQHAEGVWMLTVVGKRSKKRLVPVSPRTVLALQAHWRDLGHDFFSSQAQGPLFSPIKIPKTRSAQARYSQPDGRPGYTSNAINALVKSGLRRVRNDLQALDMIDDGIEVSPEDIEQMASTSPHAFRHTFGSIAVDKEMPLHIVQEILGHEDSVTTALYVKAREQRIASEAAKFYGNPALNKTEL